MRFIQSPMNVMMPETFMEPYQQVVDKEGVTRQKLLLAAAKEFNVTVVGSMSLM